jgi:phosphoribosylanthranilate isomerase
MYVKVCGITRVDDALAAVAAGADALGFNFIPESRRFVEPSLARTIIDQLGQTAVCVAVVANRAPEDLRGLMRETGVHLLQLHGDEPAGDVEMLAPSAFKALRIGSANDVRIAVSFPGQPLLVDAKVEGQLGGTGQAVDWTLVAPLARARPLMLAGGLNADNVATAISLVEPWGVDVASGVESGKTPRRKDHNEMRRFVRAARAAADACTHPRHALALAPGVGRR